MVSKNTKSGLKGRLIKGGHLFERNLVRWNPTLLRSDERFSSSIWPTRESAGDPSHVLSSNEHLSHLVQSLAPGPSVPVIPFTSNHIQSPR